MVIFVNGQEKEVSDSCSMAELIALLELGDYRIAVELNEELLPRSEFDQQSLQSGDRVEIVQAIGGG